MKKPLVWGAALALVVVLSALAANVVQSGWTTTSDPQAARRALGVEGGDNLFSSVTVTNGITNFVLSANSAVKADANQKLASIPAGGASTFLEGVTPPAFRLLSWTDFPSGGATNGQSMQWNGSAWIPTNIVTLIQQITFTTITVSNLYATNIITTNLYAVTLVTSNLYATNLITTNLYAYFAYITNLYSSVAYITNLNVSVISNTTDITINTNVVINNNLTVKGGLTVQSNFYAANGTFTNGITNLSLTANTVLRADANKAESSIPNASGALTNDGSGNVGYFDLAHPVTSTDIPMGAWFTNNISSDIAVTVSPANVISVTNAGDGMVFAHTNGTSAVTNCIRTRFSLPWDWNLGTVKIGLISVCSGTNSSVATNIVWAVRAAALGQSDNVSAPTFGTAVRVVGNVSTNLWVQGSETISAALTVGNTPAQNKGILWEIQRWGGDASDTETNGNLALVQFRVYYQKAIRTDFP